MNTTALFSELFVNGIITLTWIILVVLGILDKSSVSVLLGCNQITSGVIFLAYSYALGVVFDRIWDLLTKPIDNHVKKNLKISADELNEHRKKLFSNKETGAEYLEYIRSRMRIARSCLCNSLLVTGAIIFFYARTANNVTTHVIIAIFITGLFFTGICFHSFRTLLQTYYKQLFGLTSKSKAGKTSTTDIGQSD